MQAIKDDLLSGSASTSRAYPRPDIYAISLQECANTQACCRKLGIILGPDYRLVRCEAMLQVSLMVFASVRVQFLTDAIYRGQIATGIGNILGNKGAVAVGMFVAGISLLFVGCHLLPHEKQVTGRNRQLTYIQQTLRLHPYKPWAGCYPSRAIPIGQSPGVPTATFPWRQGPIEPTIGSGYRPNQTSTSAPTSPHSPRDSPDSGPTCITQQFQYSIWLGDLNYRVVGRRRVVEQMLRDDKLDVLLGSDQLRREMGRNHVFPGFREGPIRFPPTFKFDVGTDRYDTSPKNRVPSWTDRILFKVLPGTPDESLRQSEYGSIPTLKDSDHRPVFARFQLDVRAAQLSRKPQETSAAARGLRRSCEGRGSSREREREAFRQEYTDAGSRDGRGGWTGDALPRWGQVRVAGGHRDGDLAHVRVSRESIRWQVAGGARSAESNIEAAAGDVGRVWSGIWGETVGTSAIESVGLEGILRCRGREYAQQNLMDMWEEALQSPRSSDFSRSFGTAENDEMGAIREQSETKFSETDGYEMGEDREMKAMQQIGRGRKQFVK